MTRVVDLKTDGRCRSLEQLQWQKMWSGPEVGRGEAVIRWNRGNQGSLWQVQE